jgi:hypothetical protein
VINDIGVDIETFLKFDKHIDGICCVYMSPYIILTYNGAAVSTKGLGVLEVAQIRRPTIEPNSSHWFLSAHIIPVFIEPIIELIY